MIAGAPSRDADGPAAIAKVAAGRPVRAVWENELGGLTFRLGTGPDQCFAKWTPAGTAIDLEWEAQRLVWAARWVVVPRLLDRGADEEGSWIVTAGLAGQSAVEERWKAQPALAVEAIGRGLRHFHDSLPVDECPFSWSAEQRVADAHTRAGTGELDPTRWHPDHRDLAVEGALGRIAEPPPVDRLVVCTRHLRPQYASRRARPLCGARRPRQPWRRRPVGRPRHRHLEHALVAVNALLELRGVRGWVDQVLIKELQKTLAA